MILRSKETCKIVHGTWEECFKRYKKIVALSKKKHQEILNLQLDIEENPHMNMKSNEYTLVWRYVYVAQRIGIKSKF